MCQHSHCHDSKVNSPCSFIYTVGNVEVGLPFVRLFYFASALDKDGSNAIIKVSDDIQQLPA